MKAATCVEPPPTVSLSFQSTPPVKAATRKLRNTNAGGGISIHAAREGGDFDDRVVIVYNIKFQSTPPVKAATKHPPNASIDSTLFQSTPPVKAATVENATTQFSVAFQSTPPVKAATRFASHQELGGAFQSTPPVKAATIGRRFTTMHSSISIHAAREGGDLARDTGIGGFRYFNPRRP